MNANNIKFKTPVDAKSSWQYVPISIRKAIKNYEQIIFLFFLPALISILGFNFIGTNFNPTKLSFNHHQIIGLYILSVALVISIVNFPASMYFRTQVIRKKIAPSLFECYRRGFKIFIKVWSVEITSYLIIFVGFILLIVPGILLFRRYWISPYYAVENSQLTIKEILKKSALETKPYDMYIYSTAGVALLISLFFAFLLDSSAIGLIFEYIFGYSVLFLPALRYCEINKKKATRA